MTLPIERVPLRRSRREFLKFAAATAAAGVKPLLTESQFPSTAQAAPLSQVEALTPWNVIPFRQDRWFPLDPNSHAGSSLEKNVLITFDEKYQTNTVEEYRTWADARIANNPAPKVVMDSYGLCHGASAAMLDLAELQALRLITEEYANQITNDEILFGLMVGRHMDDIQKRKNPFNEVESVEDIVQRLRTELVPAVVEIENGLAGVWYYGAHGYRGSRIIISGFGVSRLEVDPQKIKRAFYPIPREGAPSSISRSLVLETAYLSKWKTNFTNFRVDEMLGYKR